MRVWPVMKARRSVPLSTSRRRRVFAPFSIAPRLLLGTGTPRPLLSLDADPTTWPPPLLFLFLLSLVRCCLPRTRKNVGPDEQGSPTEPINSLMYRPRCLALNNFADLPWSLTPSKEWFGLLRTARLVSVSPQVPYSKALAKHKGQHVL
jgi:hypothetical protein